MSSRLFARRKKKATTLVSKQTLEQAIQEGAALVDHFSNSRDKRLDQLQEAVGFLESVLHKSSMEMQQEGASTLDDYLDDAVMPEMAQKIKQDVDMIAKMKNAKGDPIGAPVQASGSDNWVSDRDENGEAKEPELAQVPRLAAKDKKAAPQAVPATPKPEADINQLSSDTLAKMQKALAGSEDLMNDKAAQAFIAAIAETLMNRPVETEAPAAPAAPAAGAAPAAAAPAPAALPVAASWGGLVIAADEDGKTGSEKVAKTPPGISEDLMHKLKKEYPGDESAAYATAWKIHNNASFAIEVLNKAASGQGGSWFVSQKSEGLQVDEDGGRTSEIGEAHSKQDDNTGIKRPETTDISKFAGDMTSGKALKTVEKLGDELKKLYFEAKPITDVLDSRPVREAVESIYRAYDMMGEAAKVLNKQHMQEESEAKALDVKEKNKKSSLFSLALAGEE